MTGSAAADTPSRPPTNRNPAAAGFLLRRLALQPDSGFASLLKRVEARASAGVRPAGGVAPVVLTAAGGGAAASLWLKVGALTGLREACASGPVAAYIVGSLALGAVLFLAGRSLWGVLGPRAMTGLRAPAGARALKTVWGASAIPQVAVLVLILPLDLLIVGTDTFTSRPLDTSLTTAWAAFSIALSLSLSVWSMFLFVRGVKVASGASAGRAVAGLGVAAASVVMLVVVLVLATAGFVQEGTCPTGRG